MNKVNVEIVDGVDFKHQLVLFESQVEGLSAFNLQKVLDALDEVDTSSYSEGSLMYNKLAKEYVKKLLIREAEHSSLSEYTKQDMYNLAKISNFIGNRSRDEVADFIDTVNKNSHLLKYVFEK